MRHSHDLSDTSLGHVSHVSNGDADLVELCSRIRTASGSSARELPALVLRYLASSLHRIEIDIYVEECLPMVCDASHAFVRAMGTFSPRKADDSLVEQSRMRLIEALETLADEIRLCKIRTAPFAHIERRPIGQQDLADGSLASAR
ncbi:MULTISPECIES: hypothetical protein [Rhizobium]|uniref:Uncharacterized protein n=1 Tax=Rhizobium rhododendri TaxID=2506430 RepID=A0ABY8IH48_9HYPH|nr:MULTISPECIES: hypothetical protein [Rhizobium]MBZ5759786.1 hypothetical protein [Rhizobium sp. VS19-DR96]MBZ5766174.1 hypothetical protein [Rhizobium sp. VS19-DR129.2]MBZ5772957.1 hypothetical protein [Rhizobium sp. VS19-DRK62.2]MBZ5783941.1 hypothetical protein [Rhizobium sp. VS19-DR121]MBZ5803518.1 hypothetical protein [Rhizobium sp. VS19-DR181]